MSLLNITGFDTGDDREADTTAGTFSFSNAVTRLGTGYSFRANPTTTATGSFQLAGSSASGVSTPFSASTPYARFWFRYATKPASGSESIFRFQQTNSMEVRLDSAGNLSFWSSTTQLGSTGTTVLAADTWYRIGVKSVSGAWEVLINGVLEISGSDTFAGAATTGSFGKVVNRNGNTVDFYYDDAAFSNSGYPTNGQCVLLLPDANGTYQTWSIGAGAGSHYQNVDEVPNDGDTTYLLSDLIAGDAETEAVSFAVSGVVVSAVKPIIICKRDGASNGSAQIRFRSGSTDTDSTASASVASYRQQFLILETDPATGIAWTVSGVDACQVGAVNQGTAFATRMTMAGLIVEYYTQSNVPRAMNQYRQRR